jgi:histidinol-phosphatase
MEESPFLKTALKAVKKAEGIVLKYYSKELRTRLKEDKSPVTEADTNAERVIVETIKESFPDHDILAEESGQENRKSEYLWVIDPIDGTKNYTRRIPLFATQIALMKGNDLILGVSNAPAINELMYAEKGKGAYLNQKRVNVSSISDLSKSYMIYGDVKYFEKHGKLSQLLSLIEQTQGHRGIGDFWSYHLLAQGKVDTMVEAETKIWDIAAVKVIVEEAGGKVTNMIGESVNRGSNSIIATNGLLHTAILSKLK